jgi:hypothetical protein
MAQNNSNSNTTTTTEAVKVCLPISEYVLKTTPVFMNYKQFNKAFPDMMTEEEFNTFAKTNQQFDDWFWNTNEDADDAPEEGDAEDEKSWKNILRDEKMLTAGKREELWEHIEDQVEEFREKMEKE